MINKNKEEIEKIKEGCRARDSWVSQDIRNCGDEYPDLNKVFRKFLCPICKTELKATIKTSIQWCEEFIRFMNKDVMEVFNKDFYEELQKYESHLKWLKEIEKEIER